jgi:hypothetical protein
MVPALLTKAGGGMITLRGVPNFCKYCDYEKEAPGLHKNLTGVMSSLKGASPPGVSNTLTVIDVDLVRTHQSM